MTQTLTCRHNPIVPLDDAELTRESLVQLT